MIFSTLEGWTPRASPLEPLAVIGRGAAAFALARRLLDRSDEELSRLRGASAMAADHTILVIGGASEALPWAPDAIYLGREAAAPALLWPIHLAPPFPADLVERALRRGFPSAGAPLVLVPEWGLASAFGAALPVRREFVSRFLAGELDPESAEEIA